MALNHSPELKSPNSKLNVAQLFGTLGLKPPFEQTYKLQCPIPNFKHLSQVALKQKFFFFIFSNVFLYVFLWLDPRTPCSGDFRTLGPLFEQTW